MNRLYLAKIFTITIALWNRRANIFVRKISGETVLNNIFKDQVCLSATINLDFCDFLLIRFVYKSGLALQNERWFFDKTRTEIEPPTCRN